MHPQAQSATELAGQAMAVEALLQEAGVLHPSWLAQLQAAWRASLARPDLSVKDVALHVGALQRFVPPQPHRPSRVHFLRQAAHMACSTYFPALHDSVVLVRSGCLVHLHKYSGLGEHCAVDDVEFARQQVMTSLLPVQRAQVLGLGYRRSVRACVGGGQLLCTQVLSVHLGEI